MTIHALAGVIALNLLFLVCGASVLWLARGWATWLELARLGGLAYFIGVAAAGAVWTVLLVVGVSLSLWLMLATLASFVLAGVLGGRKLGRAVPTLGSVTANDGLIVGAVGVMAAGLFFEVLFRATRLSGLYSWDAWSFWVPKGKAIYFFGGLDEQFFTTLPGPSYPPLVPVLDAAAFHAMGSADVVTLHLQFWFLGLGFVWSLAGLLSERIPAWILWPFMLVLLVAPRLGQRFAVPEADFLLDFFFALAAVLVAFWLLDEERWRLVVATTLLCGMVLTKREGLLLGAVLVAAALVASARRWRTAWPALGLAAVVTLAVAAPWRIWYLIHGVGGERISEGLDPGVNTERLWPSVRLALDVLSDSGYWNVIVPVAVGALIVAALARATVLVVFFGTLIALVTLGGGWITWAIPELPITQELGGNPIVRYMGSAALVCVVASPILLDAAWTAVTEDRGKEGLG